MFEKTELDKIKSILESNVGQRIHLSAKKGRKKTSVNVGVIESVYPSIFTVKIERNDANGVYTPRRVSFSYADVLTRTVELSLFTTIPATPPDVVKEDDVKTTEEVPSAV